MRFETDVNLAGFMLDLCMTLQAKVGVTLDQKLPVYRAVRVVAHGAALSQRLMLENERAGLFPMTLSTASIKPCHGQPTCRFENVYPVRIMALDAIHTALQDRVMLG
jgi:hypothetical protein